MFSKPSTERFLDGKVASVRCMVRTILRLPQQTIIPEHSLLTPPSSDSGSSQPLVKRPAPQVHVHQLSPTFFLPRAAQIEPNALAVVHTTANGKHLKRTYQETANRSKGLAYYLRKHAFTKVGILCPNTPAFLESIFGIGGAGAVSAAVNYRFGPSDVKYAFEHSEVDAIIVDVEYEQLLSEFRAANPHVHIIVDTDTDRNDGSYDLAIQEGHLYDEDTGRKGWQGLQMEAQSEEDLIALAYTSGTTARPKGVEYTHRGAYLAALANALENGLNTHRAGTDHCHYLWTLPMFHTMGWTFPWAVTAVRGTHYMLRKIDYPKIWNLLKNEKISHYCAAPTVNTLLCADSNAVKLDEPVRVTVAGSPPTAHLFEAMVGLNLHPTHVYGLTETYGPITMSYPLPHWQSLPAQEKYAKLARQGHAFLTSMNARVVRRQYEEQEEISHNDQIIEVTRNAAEIGEVVFSGNICAKGYHKDPEATRKLFAGGVLHTGDLAVWHPDGAIQILDRQKDVIISGGENISSVAVESAIVQHPSVLEAACVAVKDIKWGEVPKAFLTLRNGQEDQSVGAEIIAWVKSEGLLPGFMIPKQVEVLLELPKTSTGKIRKDVLRDSVSTAG